MSTFLRPYHIKYKAEVHKELRDIPPISCVPSKLNQILLNIIVNAAQAIEDQGDITIQSYVSDDYGVVSISDTGTGIAEDKLENIFEPFYTTKDVGKGTGQGLSISYNIIDECGGRISVNSVLGEGTEVVVSIPISNMADPFFEETIPSTEIV